MSQPSSSKPKSKLSSVDEYGFERKPDFDAHEYEEFMSDYLATLTRRGKKWESLVGKKNSMGRNRKVKRYIKKGVPLKYRGKVWMAVSGAETKKNLKPNYYKKLLQGSKNEELLQTIKLDLNRTFPDNIHFKGFDSLKLKSLSNVLEAFGLHNPNIGYCQGLNYIVGLLLLVDNDEENAFWLLTVLVEDILPGYHTQDMIGALADIYTLQELIRERKPLILKHLEFNQVEPSLVVTKWFICLFMEVLPIETVLRIWDCVFYEGSKVVLRVALFLITSNEGPLLRSHDLPSLVRCFQEIVRKDTLKCHEFIEKVYENTNFLHRSHIEQLRAEGRRKALMEREEHDKRNLT